MVRPMTAADRETVLGIIKNTGMFTDAEEAVARELIDIYLQQPGQREYFSVVTEDDGRRVVGYMTYGPTSLSVGTYDLYWMAVAPSTQGRGHGKELVRWLEGKVRELQGRMILIETSSTPHYAPTRKFYLGLGYKEVARIPDYYKPGDDRVIYTKHYPFKE
jgi:ribosomal protein S18 acetylase RimI-like enzyme